MRDIPEDVSNSLGCFVSMRRIIAQGGESSDGWWNLAISSLLLVSKVATMLFALCVASVVVRLVAVFVLLLCELCCPCYGFGWVCCWVCIWVD